MFGKDKKKAPKRVSPRKAPVKKAAQKPVPQKQVQSARSADAPVKAAAPRSAQEARGAVEITSDAFLSKLSPEAQAQLEANEKIMAEVKKFVEENPEEAGQLLRVWLKAAKEGK
jgi:flagellar biosynthesis/type III secretory pathway M-ring protein FliF/YscJ